MRSGQLKIDFRATRGLEALRPLEEGASHGSTSYVAIVTFPVHETNPAAQFAEHQQSFAAF